MTEEKQKIRTFRDLRIWQKSIKLVSQIYEITQSFPKEEAFLRFLQIAIGSLYELQTQLVITKKLIIFF